MKPHLSTPAQLVVWALGRGQSGRCSRRKDRALCHNTIMALIGGRAHPYRHFYASRLIDQGFGPKWVQYLMGHSSIQMTLDIYGHLFPQEDDHARLAAAELALVG